jgi:hypothetical protein
MKTKIRYRLYITHPKTKKESKAIQSTTLIALAKKLALNVYLADDYYSIDGKRAKLRLVAEAVEGKKIRVLETYTLTKDWKIKGFIKNWENLD